MILDVGPDLRSMYVEFNAYLTLEYTYLGILQNKFPELLSAGAHVAVGVFHSYAHSMSCQIKSNPRYLKGFGLADGEGLERLWSYLGGFVSMTRQMSSKRRVLTISHGLQHFK